MHLGLDLLFLVPGETGGRETYARELLTALREVAPRLRVTTFLNAETAAAGPGWWSEQADRALVLRRVSARSAPSWALGELVWLARAASRAGVDVLHGPANFAPWSGPFTRVLTLHDMLFRRSREHVAPLMRAGTEAILPRAARRAQRVITGADDARDTIVAELGVPAERIDVVPHGVSVPRARGDGARARARVRSGGRPLVLAVATALPHKNLPALLDGLAAMAPEERPLLALAGHGTDALAEPARALGLQDDVRALGSVTGAELEDLWAAADAMATPTLYEGFGLPVLEAMARGVPVACSDLPVLREVAGDAALWFDPRDGASIAGALRRVLAETPEVARLREAGRARAARYTWRAAAEGTLASYERARA